MGSRNAVILEEYGHRGDRRESWMEAKWDLRLVGREHQKDETDLRTEVCRGVPNSLKVDDPSNRYLPQMQCTYCTINGMEQSLSLWLECCLRSERAWFLQ